MGDNQEREELTIPIPPQPNSENLDSPFFVGEHGESLSAGCEQPPDENPDSEGCCSCEDVFIFVLTALAFIILVPMFLLYELGAYLAFGIDVTEESTPQEGGKKGIYQKVQEFQETAVRLAKLVSVIRGRVLICILVWFVVNISVPSLRRKTVFGSQLWKWTLLAVIVTCGYSAISIASHVFLYSVTKTYNGKNDFVYYLRGLRRSISFTLYLVSVLSTWLFYFRSRDGLRGTKTHISNDVFDFMSWTLVSLLISALLWLLKTVLLLKWEAHAVYKRFRDRILRAGFQLYFLALISGTYWDIFRPGENTDVEVEAEVEKAGEEKSATASGEKDIKIVRAATIDGNNNTPEDGRKEKEKEEEKRRAKDILHIGDRMLSKNVTTYGIKQMAGYFVALARLSSREDDDISDLLATCQEVIPHDGEHIIKGNLLEAFQLDEKEVDLLFAELQGTHTSEKVSYATFEKWMARAHKHCLALGYTLTDAKKVVEYLNKLMIGFLIAAVVLFWLLLTEIATTKLLVVIASPILAATFIFGDTCKTLFEGIIFSFVKHPFDVGDLCIIDGIEMEVKCMGILTTYFMKMGTKDQALYPNSLLATKAIVNLKGDPNPADFVELCLDPSTEKSKITHLEDKIKK
ncbi:hypothetical protein Nepgr_019444 [Nepenthes gracilis]|uniref:Mechanosensitive ion channel MscS domain-containing protein n=1 Tax=Nepenthes gracilis TaxID=150966 RepID=A0AAD3SU07_NEPGR|nr:hypothetical protein Nepgr_019444 [Nepenthes gracilis]